MTAASQDLPAIILGHGLTVLGVIRGLGRVGVPAYCHGPQPSFVTDSRYYRRYAPVSALPDTEDSLERVLAVSPFERAVLIPCTDNWVKAVAAMPGDLAARFPSSSPRADIASLFVDKRRFSQLLENHGIPSPKTLILPLGASVDTAVFGEVEQGFLKPVDSQAFGTHFKKKAFTFSSIDEGQRLLREATLAGFEMILQEYIPGPSSEHYFIDGFMDRTGTVKGWFARRRLRMYPPKFGNSTYLVSIPAGQIREDMNRLEALLKSLHYRGIFSVEYKHDPRDNQMKMLEINARPWWYIGFATDSGVNVAHMAYLDALWRAVPESDGFRPGVRFVFTDYDSMACRELLARKALTRGQWAWQWLTAKQAICVWYDPRPSLKRWLGRLKQAFAART